MHITQYYINVFDLSRESNLTIMLKQHRPILTTLCSSWSMSFDCGMVIQPTCGRKYGRLNGKNTLDSHAPTSWCVLINVSWKTTYFKHSDRLISGRFFV
jgi:hypothetical protein